MRIFYCLGLNNSISRLALCVALGTVATHSAGISNASAVDLIYDNDAPDSMLIFGGPSFEPNVSGKYNLFPGTADEPLASNNNITVDYSDVNKTAPNRVYGGLGEDGTVLENNRVFIKNGTVTFVYGAVSKGNIDYVGDTVVQNNVVEITGGLIINSAYGASASYNHQGTSVVSGNGIIMSGGGYLYNNALYGAYAGSNPTGISPPQNTLIMTDNFVEFSGGENIYSITASFGAVQQGKLFSSRNYVNITDGYVVTNVIGAQASYTSANSFKNNQLDIRENYVTVSGGSIDGDVYGAYSRNTTNAFDETQIPTTVSNNNYVEITGGNVSGDVYGASVLLTKSNTYSYSDVELSGNSVKLDGGQVGGNIYGAYGNGYSDGVMNISGNFVELKSGSVSGDVYGGFGYITSTQYGEMDYTVTDNTVTLHGTNGMIDHEFTNGIMQYGSIWGGRIVRDDGSEITDFDKVVKGNTLNIVGYRGTVYGVHNFENFNWTLPDNVVNGDILINIANGGTAVDLTYTKHTVANMQVTGNRLNVGDEITFISKTQGDFSSTNYRIKQGQFIVYDATLSQKVNGDDQALVLTVSNSDVTDLLPDNDNSNVGNGNGTGGDQSAAKVNPQSKAYSEGRAATLGLISQANDLIAVAGIDQVRHNVRSNEGMANRPKLIPFLLTNGSYQSHKSGSHVDIKSFNLAAGFATGFEFASGHKATVGAFFEYGHGSYNTYNQFAGFSAVHGDGNSTYKGGGILARVDFAGTGLGRVNQLAPYQADGFYAEASLRAGRISNTFDAGRHAGVYSDADGYGGSYDSKVSYYGGHLAGGYVFNFDEKQSLDAYGRYLWTYMDSDSVTIMNEKLRFDRSNSSRIQIGTRYSYDYSDQFKPYVGAIYEYEFDGEIKAKAYEFSLGRPSLQGSTGVFEAGFSFRPIVKNKSLNIDVNGQAYTGQRQGGGGGVKVNYQF